MKILLAIFCTLLFSGCSVMKAPSSWNAQPLVIDSNQDFYTEISNASNHTELISKSNSVRKKIQSLISLSRRNLDRSSGGNYGAGLLAAAVGLSSLHSDALLGAGYLAGTHVALSNRLSPIGYMQQLQRSSNAFYCLDSLAMNYFDVAEKTFEASNNVQFKGSTQFLSLGYSSNIYSYALVDFGKFQQSYLRALELSQEKLDSQISLALPADIQGQLINAAKEAAKDEIEIDTLPDGSSIKEFLVEHERLDADLLACIAII